MGDPDRNDPSSRYSLFEPAEATEWASVCADLVGAHGAAIVAATASHPDTHRVLAGTDAVADRVADLLYVLGDGPHAVSMTDDVSCAVVVDDVADQVRWPGVVGELNELGVGWVQTYPICAGGIVVGTVQLYRRTPPIPPVSDGIAAFVAHLTRAMGADLVSGLVGGPEEGGGDADTVNVAIGVLAARHAVAIGAASALLRAGA